MDTASHSLVLLQQLNMQREFGFLCDCTVAIGDVYFKAHRAVLAAFSNYFKMIFIHQTSECIKIQPTDIQPDIFSYLLHIMYTGKGPKQIVDHSRLEEGIRFLHADYLSHIATEMNQVFSPETVQSSNLYGIQISTTQKTAVKEGLEVKETPSNNNGNRAAVQGDHPQLQLSLAIGLDDGTDQQKVHPAAQALEEHQKPPVSIKQERCDSESVISQSHSSSSSEMTGPTFTESSIKIHLCHYCGERFDSRGNLRQHLHTHVSGSLPFGVPASILESNDLGEVHPLNENSEALECRRLSSFIVKENEQQPDHSNRGTTEPLQISQVSLISKDTEPVELNCNFSFSRKRKISCTICGHKFLRKSQLLEHMYTHKAMDLKKVSAKDSAEKKKRMMCIELKKEIIKKHDQGVRVIDLAKQYERSTSTICTILKQKELIQATTPAKGVKIISKQRTSIHENMEKLLMVWLTEKQLAGDTVTKAIICEKARAIYADLLQQTPGTSVDEASGEPFKASRGWFENFKKRTGIHPAVRHGEAASADVKGGDINELIEEHPEELTTQGLKELQTQQHTEALQEIDDTEEEEEIISVSEIKEMLGMWEKLSDFIQKKHLEKIATGCAMELFNDTCLTHFRNILKGRMKQISLDRFLSKTPVDESDESMAKRAKISK